MSTATDILSPDHYQPNETIQSGYRAYLKHHGVSGRGGQKRMIADIARYLGAIQTNADGLRTSQDAVCVVEAGTGTGKTLAYLLATIPYAVTLGKKIIIAAATVTQQQQILKGELPRLQAATAWPLQVELAKGRGRFLCLNRLELLLAGSEGLFPGLPAGPTSAGAGATNSADSELIEGFARTHYEGLLSRFTSRQWTGDIDSLDDDLPNGLWQTVITDNRSCFNRDCDFFSQCPYFRQRAQIESADIVIANQDLLLSDIRLGGGVVLPALKDSILIIDEAHQLPEKALNHFSAFAGLGSSQQQLAEMKARADAAEHLRLSDHKLGERLGDISKHAVEAGELLRELWEWQQTQAQWPEKTDRFEQQPLLQRYEAGACPETLRELAGKLSQQSDKLQAALGDILGGIAQMLDKDNIDPDDSERLQGESLAFSGDQTYVDTLQRLYHQISEIPDESSRMQRPPIAVWWTKMSQDSGDLVLHASPTHGGSYLAEQVWQNAFAAICTSATMSDGHDQSASAFRRFSDTAGLPAGSVFAVHESPFDYSEHCTLRIMNARQRPGDSASYIAELSAAIADALNFDEATLVLFSSRKQFTAVMARLEQLLEKTRFESMLSQLSAQPAQLIEAHRQRMTAGQGSVLLGMASFAEGLDLPGELLTHLIICKLPFAVPDDPVESTYSEWLQARGGKPFDEVSLPDAIIRFRQAFGRLIRTEKDQGRVTVLDSRLLTKRYGRRFIEALPRCRIQRFEPPAG
ncbi:ATP-dependent DNA helicase DinG [Allohahella marinimesophila]|uniref:ATP-dependent DNA helicase DinG n=1 Tax=Allohahella marinimesophila TaxID=1054972 RepID=A0ABP7PEM9_9GAMM